MACLHPVKIKNRNGEYMDVPCGRCYGCLNKKRVTLTTLTKLEGMKHKFIMFITLTYAPEYLPTCTAKFHRGRDGKHSLRIRYTSPRMIKYYQTDRCASIDVESNRHYVLKELLKPFANEAFKLPKRGEFGILWRRDVVNFNKRLRYYINQYNSKNNRHETPYRFLFVGEYGPKRFRPHYHAVLFLEDDEISTQMSTFVAKAWKYGRVDVQLSEGGNCAKYVAGYVASNSYSPALLRFSWSKPFALHSIRFGQSSDEETLKDCQSLEYSRISRRVYAIDGRLREVPPSVSLQSAIYPKCYAFGVSSDDFNLKRYRLVSYLHQYLEREGRTPEGVTDIWRIFCRNFDYWNEKIVGGSSLLELFSGSSNYETALYTALNVSRRFMLLCERYRVSDWYYYHHVIKKYYKDKDYRIMVDGIQRMCEDVDNGLPVEHLIHRYGNIPNLEIDEFFADGVHGENFHHFVALDHFAEDIGMDFESVCVLYNDYTLDPLYSSNYMEQSRFYKDSIKHKEQNDLNKLLYGY